MPVEQDLLVQEMPVFYLVLGELCYMKSNYSEELEFKMLMNFVCTCVFVCVCVCVCVGGGRGYVSLSLP